MPITNYTYDKITLDLSLERTDLLLSISGNYIKVLDASDLHAVVDIKLNESFKDSIPLKKGRSIRGSYFDIYLTNNSQSGKSITIIFATLSSVYIEDDVVFGDVDINYLPSHLFDDDYTRSNENLHNSGTLADGGSEIVYTIPAGKFLYIQNCGLLFHSDGTALSADLELSIFTSGSVYKETLIGISAFGSTGVNLREGNHENINFIPMIKVSENETIRLYNSHGSTLPVGSCRGWINGYIK